MKFAFAPLQKADAAHKIFFYDDISRLGEFDWNEWAYKESETSAKFIQKKLDEIPAGATIEVHVNSRGGDVGEGTAIYNLLCQKAKNDGCRIVGYVDGYAYSIAMTIVMACDEIHMGLGTSMFLHMPWMVVAGNAKELRSAADDLDVLSEASLQLYLHRAKNLTEDELRELMEKETTLGPQDCLAFGFCDVVDTYEAEELPAQQREDSGARQRTIDEVAEMLRDLQTNQNAAAEPAPPAAAEKPDMMSTLIAAMKGV